MQSVKFSNKLLPLGRNVCRYSSDVQRSYKQAVIRAFSVRTAVCFEKATSHSKIDARAHHIGQPVQVKSFTTMSARCSQEKGEKEPADEKIKPLTQRQKLTRIFAAYGTTAVAFHTTISLTSLGICYTIVNSGIDMVAILQKVGITSEAGLQSTLASGASTFVIAYACHKVFMPVRIFLTVTCTPVIVGKLQKMGILKQKVAKQ